MRSPCTTKKSSPRSPQLEKARAQQQRPKAAKKKKKNEKHVGWGNIVEAIFGKYNLL